MAGHRAGERGYPALYFRRLKGSSELARRRGPKAPSHDAYFPLTDHQNIS
jgi:hypothetical protein